MKQHPLPTAQALHKLNVTSGDLLSGRETDEQELTRSFLNDHTATTGAPISVQYADQVSFANMHQKAQQKYWRRTLSIKKRLREHLIVKKYYD